MPVSRSCPVASALAVVCGASSALALPAFPGAEGFGAAVTGGRGGDVYHVTSLLDTNSPGTFRFGVNNAPAGGRTIVFDVSGMITLGSNLTISKNNITVAGQTAPGQGITFRGWESAVGNTTASPSSNVIVRYLRYRPGDLNGPLNKASPNYQGDSIHVRFAKNVIFDHLSTSWSIDEVLSASSCDNVTIQRSLIGEALKNAGHDNGAGGVEPHAFGMLLGSTDANFLGRISVHHSIFTSNDTRNPRIGNDNQLDFVNNVLYNWGGRCGYSGGAAEGTPKMNYVGNYLIAGPSTTSGHANEAFYGGSTNTQIYQSGNLIDSNKNTVRDGTNTGTTMFTSAGGTQTFVASPFEYPSIITDGASANYAKVLSDAGVSIYRDDVDVRMVNNIIIGTGAIIDSQTQVNGWPTLPEVARAAGYDSDNDGIPNAWEVSVGTNPNVANNNADFDNDGYTDLEEYLNDVGAFAAPTKLLWNGTSSRFALSSNWTADWQPSRLDAASIPAGTATVDAVGQRVGSLTIIGGAMNVTAGWIDVASGFQLGGANGSGTVTQTGGTVIAESGITMHDAPSAAAFAINYNLNGGTLATTSVSSPGHGTSLNFNGGTLTPLASSAAFISASVGAKVQSGGARIDTAGFDITILAPLLHDAALGAAADGGLTKSGAGTLTLSSPANSFTGPTSVTGGQLLLAKGLKTGNALSVATGTVLEIAPDGSSGGVSLLKAVAVAGTGKLELHNNDLIVDYTGGSTLYATIVNLVKSGLTGLGGSGSGITSTEVNSGSLPGTTLAVIDDSGIVATLSGMTVPNPASSVLVKYTWVGDANLDGVVNGSDYALLDTGFAGGGNRWAQGDFNYSGSVNGSDYALIDTGFSSQSGALPEPGSLGLLAAAGLLLRSRSPRHAGRARR